MKLPVYSRAEIPRTAVIVVALLLTVVTTIASAHEFRAANTQSEDYPTVQALRDMGRLIAEKSGGRLQMAAAQLIERIRKVN
jgi:TRAP-type C4-dicarboxylate transport system substrate-binding protein